MENVKYSLEVKGSVDETEHEKVEDLKMLSEEKNGLNHVGGVAGLLGQTASILSLLVKQEEEKPKLSLDPEDVETYKEAFNDFDHNKDGHISTQVSELSSYCQNDFGVGKTKQYFDELFWLQELHLALRRA